MGIRLYLRSGGKLRQWRGDASGVAAAFTALPSAGVATIAAQGQGLDMLLLRRNGDGTFRFRVVDRSGPGVDRGGPGALGYSFSARRDHSTTTAQQLLALYVGGDEAWRSAVRWRRSVFDLPVAILAPATILVCVIGYFVVAGATGGLKGWSWRYLPNLVVGLVLIGAVFAYVDWFFRRLRKHFAARLGRMFGLRIVEAEELGIFTRPGMWESADGGVVSTITVALLDFAVLLFGLLIPTFAIATAIVLAARPILA